MFLWQQCYIELINCTSSLINDNVFQGAIDMLFEEHVLTPVTFMRFLKSRSIDLFPDDVEEILHLRKGTLDVEETKPRIVRLKLL